jgi:predicted glycosyltransferase
VVTDNGETLADLEARGVDITTKMTEPSSLATILTEFGIQRQSISKKLFIQTSQDDFPDAKQRLVQVILRIIDNWNSE